MLKKASYAVKSEATSRTFQIDDAFFARFLNVTIQPILIAILAFCKNMMVIFKSMLW